MSEQIASDKETDQCLIHMFTVFSTPYRGKGAGDEGGVVSAAKRVEGDLLEPGVEVGLEEVHLSSHSLRSRVHSGSRWHIGGLVGAFTKRTNVVRISLATHDHYKYENGTHLSSAPDRSYTCHLMSWVLAPKKAPQQSRRKRSTIEPWNTHVRCTIVLRRYFTSHNGSKSHMYAYGYVR